ncbi:hypothetical protein LOS78_20005 (plasmid) [Paracoccus sp. MA]|uniref:hypothetical protein n=1 Tax=Paracoccus sp. MA TaxID=2895796 RepID=UPI001E29EE84|nr:hypothetical protein [Paracoccus sp. MA]UFM67380.1 hypothetical protein LOS78_20005 [Paracoccus sp. MA]
MARILLTLAFLFGPALALAEPLAGRWSGTYACNALGGAQFTLETEQAGNGIISGTFSFEIGTGGRALKGAYKVMGRGGADGFRLQPRDWIERPPGVEALALSGRTRDGGAVIEGEMEGCALNDRFLGASAEGMAVRLEDANSEPVPPTMGPPAGRWKGEVICRGQRKTTLSHPIEAVILTDGDRVAADARVHVANQQGGVPAEQRTILGGQSAEGRLELAGLGSLSPGGPRFQINGLSLAVDGQSLSGPVNMRGCDKVSLTYAGPAAVPPLPDSMTGSWVGTAEQQNGAIAMHFELRNGRAGGFGELRLGAPAHLPVERRSKLHLVLAPVGELNGWQLMLPLGQRAFEISQDDVRRHSSGPVGPFAKAGAYLVSETPAGGLELVALIRSGDFAVAASLKPGTPPGPKTSVLVLQRSEGGLADAVVAGETPPVIFPEPLGGTLAAARSREAQCAVLQEWITPYSEGKDMRGTVIANLQRELAEAFTDAKFEPVFGLPFALLSDEERRALARFIREDCEQGQGMADVGFAGAQVIGHQRGYREMVKRLTDVAESSRWAEAALDEAQALSSTAASLARIEQLKAGARDRARELSARQIAGLDAGLALRARQIRTDILRADIDRDLPGLSAGSREDGALDQLFRLAGRIADEDILPDARQELHDRIAPPALKISDEYVTALMAEVDTLPASLQGLADARRIGAALGPVVEAVHEHFGADLRPRIQPLFLRRSVIESDPAVLEAFRKLLADAPSGRGAKEAVRAAAAQYLDEAAMQRLPEYGAVYKAALEHAEWRAIIITDNSRNPGRDEPRAEDIARFALDRVREVNATISQIEDDCLQGVAAIGNSPARGIECLTMPAVWTGQKGFASELVSVTKISCSPDAGGFRCYFQQEIQFFGPGGARMNLEDFIGTFGERAARLEVQEALFIPGNEGWQVLWGDLR